MAITNLSLDTVSSSLPFAELNSEVKPPAPIQETQSDSDQSPESSQRELQQERFQDTDRQLQDIVGPGIGLNSELSISVDKTSKQIVVKVLDKETKEVIREIPPERLARIAESLKELSLGLVDERA